MTTFAPIAHPGFGPENKGLKAYEILVDGVRVGRASPYKSVTTHHVNAGGGMSVERGWIADRKDNDGSMTYRGAIRIWKGSRASVTERLIASLAA
jgi:hypothetical protein